MKMPAWTLMRSLLLYLFFGTIGVLCFTLFKFDASSQPLDAYLYPDLSDKTYHQRNLVVLVNYGDGDQVYIKNQNGLMQSAVNKGFNVMTSYHRGHIDPEFYEKNKGTLDQRRGAGYWLWKPYFILRTLRQYPDNTTVVYADSGVVFSKPLTPLFKMLDKTPLILVGNGRAVALRSHLKVEARNLLQISDQDPRLDDQKIWAFFMVVKNTPEVRKLVEEWLRLCEIKELLTDTPFDQNIQEKGFYWHLHDEALWSIVVATYAQQNADKVTIIPKNILRKNYGVVNFHRHPEDEYKSPLLISAGLPQWVSSFVFNNIVVQWVRRAWS